MKYLTKITALILALLPLFIVFDLAPSHQWLSAGIFTLTLTSLIQFGLWKATDPFAQSHQGILLFTMLPSSLLLLLASCEVIQRFITRGILMPLYVIIIYFGGLSVYCVTIYSVYFKQPPSKLHE